MKISKEVAVRAILLILALLNQLLASAGKGTFEFTEDGVYQFVSFAFTVGTIAWGWWKNNSVTLAARISDKLMKAIKEDGIESFKELLDRFGIEVDGGEKDAE